MTPSNTSEFVAITDEKAPFKAWLKSQLDSYFGLAKKYLNEDGARLVNSQDGKKKSILSPLEKRMTVVGITRDSNFFVGFNDVMRLNNNFYVFLNATSYLPTEKPEESDVKVVVDQHYNYFNLTSIKNTVTETKNPIAPIYLLTPIEKFPVIDLLDPEKYETYPIQIAQLALNIFRCTVDFNAKDLVYRNIKPEKFVATFDENGDSRVYFSDFSDTRLMKKEAHSNEFVLKSRKLIGTEGFFPPAFATTPERYAYNFATDIYSAAVSALAILAHIDMANLSHEETQHLVPFINSIKAFAGNITLDQMYLAGYPSISAEKKSTILQDITRLEAMYLTTKDGLYPSVVASVESSEPEEAQKTVFKRAESPVNVSPGKFHDTSSPFSSPAGVELIPEFFPTPSIPLDFTYSEELKKNILNLIWAYKEHVTKKNNTETAHVTFLELSSEDELSKNTLDRQILESNIGNSLSHADIFNSLQTFQNSKQHSLNSMILLKSLVQLIDAEIKKPTASMADLAKSRNNKTQTP